MPDNSSNTTQHAAMANAIRFLAADAVEAAGSGHPGMPMGMADVATVLFSQYIKLNPSDPTWADRDRFVLSAGHGSMLHYAVNYLLGYKDMTLDAIRQFRQLGSITAGHPEHGLASGIEMTTGPLGQGLGAAVGMALAERLLAKRFGKKLVNHRTWVIAGDGCLMEGISHEAIDLAGHLRLNKLTVLWDNNAITIDGATKLATSSNQLQRFRAAGWYAQAVDGHDPKAIADALDNAISTKKPSMIACKTTIGYGAPNLGGTAKSHGSPLGEAEVAAVRKALGWQHPPFVVPDHILTAWRQVGTRSVGEYKNWQARVKASPRAKRFKNTLGLQHPRRLKGVLRDHIKKVKATSPHQATRQASLATLEVINHTTPLTVGGSADLTGSNLTQTSNLQPIRAWRVKDKTDSKEKLRPYHGRYIHYGAREHGMLAAMNGMALHGGIVPYGGSFLVFTDYARASLRLAALMQQQVIAVMTHDSIGLGEDGPTHQPIEHLAMLRATPNLYCLRPADAVEVAECWEVALWLRAAPSVLALSRQKTPALRQEKGYINMCKLGGYILNSKRWNFMKRRDITLLATGTEVALAMAAAATLKEKHDIRAAVVSMPCQELFDQQDAVYRHRVLGTAPRIVIEAACRFGWDKYIGEGGGFIGMESFGASAPYEALYQHFGITEDAIVKMALQLVA